MDGCSPQAEGEKYKISHGLWVYVFEMTSDLYGVWVIHVFVLGENACSFKIQIFKVLFCVCYRLSIFGVCEC